MTELPSAVVEVRNICAWGLVNEVRQAVGGGWHTVDSAKYSCRGWPVAEYSCARVSGTISNSTDPDVVEVEQWRDWPNTFEEYQQLMKRKQPGGESEITFAGKGDRDVVAQIFFRMAYSISGSRRVQRSRVGRPADHVQRTRMVVQRRAGKATGARDQERVIAII